MTLQHLSFPLSVRSFMDPRYRPKILYIDDTPQARSLVLRILSRDYIVLEASDALSGIELAIEAEPDLVLIDINLPQLTGRAVAARLKSLLPNTVLVAFSADVSPGARERALAAGCVGYLTKPLDVDTFADEIAEFLRGKRETLHDQDKYKDAFANELVERLEEKVRELTKTAERNAWLNEQNQQLVVSLQRRQHLLEAAARVGGVITSILDLDELLRVTVDIICEEYGFYYAGIFLLDETQQWAVLRAGHGQAGQSMLAEGYRLPVGDESVVGLALLNRAARVELDLNGDAQRLQNPSLHKTRSEAALPLMVKDSVLGALSVQSDQANAFSSDDLTALQALTDQAAIAINNARLLLDLSKANHELVRTKTFEAIATTTGQTIHWVGNKAAPIPSSVRRVREDLLNLLAAFQAVLALPIEKRSQHPLWNMVRDGLETASAQGADLQKIAVELAALTPKSLGRIGRVDSILEDLAIIQQSAATILDIKEDLIGPVRLQHITALQLPELIEQTVYQMALPDGVIQLRVAPDLPPVRGDARQIGQVFNNLIKNAWEALFDHPEKKQPQITITACRAEDPRFVMITVSDNGPGIPPDILDKIWVSFFTTKGHRGGTGLGLSACVSIINQSEGRITVESQLGMGTTFNVLLPAAEDRPAHENEL